MNNWFTQIGSWSWESGVQISTLSDLSNHLQRFASSSTDQHRGSNIMMFFQPP